MAQAQEPKSKPGSDLKPSQQWKHGLTGGQINIKLAKRMGAGGYDICPPDQHRWQFRRGEPLVYRIWSWFMEHCCGYGHQSEFAVDLDGNELHFAHLVEHLGNLDPGYVNREFNKGVERGMWRRGTKKEGTDRLYFCGKVSELHREANPENQAEADAQNVCADILPKAIYLQTKEWATERLQKLEQEYQREIEAVADKLESAAIAAAREIIILKEHTFFSAHGLEVEVQIHRQKGETREQAAARRAAHVTQLQPVLAGLELLVQTFSETQKLSVQAVNGTAYTPENGVRTDAPTLLQQASTRPKPDQPETRAGSAVAPEGRHSHQGVGSKSLPAFPALPPAPALSAEEQKCVDLWFSEMRMIQKQFPKATFALEPVNPARQSHLWLARSVVSTVGHVEFVPFLDASCRRLHSAMKRTHAMGRMPEGILTLGIFKKWAKDWKPSATPAPATEKSKPAAARASDAGICYAILADPMEPAEMKQLARETLRELGLPEKG